MRWFRRKRQPAEPEFDRKVALDSLVKAACDDYHTLNQYTPGNMLGSLRAGLEDALVNRQKRPLEVTRYHLDQFEDLVRIQRTYEYDELKERRFDIFDTAEELGIAKELEERVRRYHKDYYDKVLSEGAALIEQFTPAIKERDAVWAPTHSPDE